MGKDSCKFLIALAAFLLVILNIWLQSCSDSQVPPQSQPTVSWDAVTSYEDNTSVTNVTYRVYIEKVGTDKVDLLLETKETQTALNLPEKGIPYYVGITSSDGTQESEIAWSYDPVFCQDQKVFQVIDNPYIPNWTVLQ